MARRSIWKGSFVDLFLMKKTRENEVSNVGLRSRDAKSSSAALRSSSTGVTILRKIWSRRSSISPEFVDCGVRIYNGKTPVRCQITEGKVGHKFGEFASTRKRRPSRTNIGPGRRGKK
uniref:Ribosomal protein S19 n=1 Tax=Nymphaea colorata TaxID=210225 RepID=A0A2P1AF35_9MAGN|nr:ribosomal protein S19 [Nymphaea colorata]